jgi:hypothetical protein
MTITTWATAGAAANFPMALDETHHRLFVGFRKPATLGVFETSSGKISANLDSTGDADYIFYDGSRQRIYIARDPSVSFNRLIPIIISR